MNDIKSDTDSIIYESDIQICAASMVRNGGLSAVEDCNHTIRRLKLRNDIVGVQNWTRIAQAVKRLLDQQN